MSHFPDIANILIAFEDKFSPRRIDFKFLILSYLFFVSYNILLFWNDANQINEYMNYDWLWLIIIGSCTGYRSILLAYQSIRESRWAFIFSYTRRYPISARSVLQKHGRKVGPCQKSALSNLQSTWGFTLGPKWTTKTWTP